MKIRNGFVSNSSSSSFIIAFKEDSAKCPTCGHKTLNIVTNINNRAGNEENIVYSHGYEEVVNDIESNFIENIKYAKGAEARDLVDKRDSEFEKMEKLLKEGYNFAKISISYHDEWLNAEFGGLRDSGEIIIIQDNN